MRRLPLIKQNAFFSSFFSQYRLENPFLFPVWRFVQCCSHRRPGHQASLIVTGSARHVEFCARCTSSSGAALISLDQRLTITRSRRNSLLSSSPPPHCYRAASLRAPSAGRPSAGPFCETWLQCRSGRTSSLSQSASKRTDSSGLHQRVWHTPNSPGNWELLRCFAD